MAQDWDSRDAWEEENEEEQPQSTGLAGMLERFQNAGWIKGHPNLLKGVAIGVLVLLMVLLLAWQTKWFDRAEPAAPAVADRPPPQGQPQPTGQPATPAVKTPASTSNPAEKNPPKPAETANAKPPEIPPLPDDVAQWKREDYFRARLENNPKLVDAIARLGERTRGSAPAAQGLTFLLTPLPPELPPVQVPPRPAPGAPPAAPGSPPGASVPARPAPLAAPPARPRSPADLQKLVETIIAALGDNGSEVARKTLEQVLSGILPTDDDKAAVQAVLKALVAHPGPENDALLVRVIAAPETVRPAERQGPWPAKELRNKAFELMKATAANELRTKLAEAMADRLSRLNADDPLRQFLLAADPLNCGAQVVFFQRNVFSKEINTKLEQQLAGYSSLALSRLLKFPGEIQPGAGGSRGFSAPGHVSSSTSDPRFQLADLLWSEAFGATVRTKLAEGRPLEKQADLVLLAGTIPRDTMRAALAKTLRKHWSEGPKALEAADAVNKMLTDPGLLVLLKMNPRRSEAKPAARPSGSRGRPVRSPPGGGAAATAKIAAEKKEQAEKDWMTLSSKLVTAWCARFQAAAQARDKTEAEAGNPSGNVAPKLPSEFEMANGAKVTTAYHLVWPAEVPAEIGSSKPSPLEIYYIRVEETNKPKKAIGYYSRQLQVKTSEVRKTDNGKADWLDSVRALQQTDRRRSVDVVLTRADNKASDATKDNQESDLIVEILTIEIKDPAGRE
jgi:hypothetical protein